MLDFYFQLPANLRRGIWAATRPGPALHPTPLRPATDPVGPRKRLETSCSFPPTRLVRLVKEPAGAARSAFTPPSLPPSRPWPRTPPRAGCSRRPLGPSARARSLLSAGLPAARASSAALVAPGTLRPLPLRGRRQRPLCLLPAPWTKNVLIPGGTMPALIIPMTGGLHCPAVPPAHLVENTGLEPVTSCLQSRRSPN